MFKHKEGELQQTQIHVNGHRHIFPTYCLLFLIDQTSDRDVITSVSAFVSQDKFMAMSLYFFHVEIDLLSDI